MIKYLRKFPTTVDIELFYLLSNIWWLIVFSCPIGYFSGITYDRSLAWLGQETLISILAIIVSIASIALLRRKFVHIALITGTLLYSYFGTISFLGNTVAFNACIFYFIAALGVYRLFSYVYYRENNEDDTGTTPR